jgi:hypothetical protein
MHLARLDCLLQRSAVGVRNHQNRTRDRILRDDGYEPIRLGEIEFVDVEGHELFPSEN